MKDNITLKVTLDFEPILKQLDDMRKAIENIEKGAENE